MTDNTNDPEIRLVQTCAGAPEQYDAFIGDEKVGVLHLRHGRFTVEAAGSGDDEPVYNARTHGDGLFTPDERAECLRAGIDAIRQWRQIHSGPAPSF